MEFPDSPNLLELPSDTSDNEEESAVDAEACSPPLQPIGQMWFDMDAGASPPPPEEEILEETSPTSLSEAQKEELFDLFHPGVAGSLQEACEMIDFPSQVDNPENDYISALAKSRDLHIRLPLRVMNAYQKHGILGFFLLFITPSRLEAMRLWTNEVLKFKKKEAVDKELFYAYLGLEMGMSLNPMNNIKDYWSATPFVGNDTFKSTMSRNVFSAIRGSVMTHPPFVSAETVGTNDPLYFCRPMLDHFRINAAQIAVPLGPMALDEASQGTSARTSAKSYNPSKPDPHAIRFYALNGCHPNYLFAIQDNGAGNKEKVSSSDRYLRQFRDMGTMHRKTHAKIDDKSDDNWLEPESASALYTLMLQHVLFQDSTGSTRRVCFMDNYYTRHNLARTLFSASGGVQRIIGQSIACIVYEH